MEDSIVIPPNAPCPRSCHVIQWDDFRGFGFNLHAEKNKTGQYIGKIDEDSPAEYAGLKAGDRIIEVNNVNVCNENHKQVVERIKAVPKETKLLVLDPLADEFYKQHKIVVKSSMPNVIEGKTPVPRPRPEVRDEAPPPEPESPPPSFDTALSNGTTEKEEHSEHNAQNDTTELPPDAPRPRLCTIRKWPDFKGYGFNLHADKQHRGHYVGTIDKDSPAELAGLKSHDRIIEVNGQSIAKDSHKDVVKKIQQHQNHTRMLVMDAEVDEWYTSRGVVVSGEHSDVVRLTNPDHQPPPSLPVTPPPDEDHIDTKMADHHNDLKSPPSPMLIESSQSSNQTSTNGHVTPRGDENVAPNNKMATNNQQDSAGLNLNMSAAEMRSRLSRKKRPDPRLDNSLDMRKKHEIFQRM